MNTLSTEKRIAVAKCLVDGVSIRATSRITGVSKDAVMKLLVDLGRACEIFHNRTVRNVAAKHVQADEIWGFVYGKDKNIAPHNKEEGRGECWVWTGIDSDSKLILAWQVGPRNAASAYLFMTDLAHRLA